MTDINVFSHGSGETRQHTQRFVGMTQVKHGQGFCRAASSLANICE